MNKASISTFMLIGAILLVVFGGGAFYVVDETQQVILTQFGKLVGKPVKEAGLYLKLPFIQTPNYFDNRILEWDGDSSQIPTLDKRLIWVDTTARWRIQDPLKFMQRVRTEAGAQTRLDDIIDAKTREVLSSHMLIEAIRNSNRILEARDALLSDDSAVDLRETALVPIKIGREDLSRQIFDLSAVTLQEYGIELIDVRVKRINYIREVQNKVYERMISERKRAAEKFRSEGQGKKAEIEGRMAKELDQIQAEAYKTAQEIKGKADAKAIEIYAKAYNLDPEFYAFTKTLETYKKTTNANATLILSTKNSFYNRLKGIADEGKIP